MGLIEDELGGFEGIFGEDPRRVEGTNRFIVDERTYEHYCVRVKNLVEQIPQLVALTLELEPTLDPEIGARKFDETNAKRVLQEEFNHLELIVAQRNIEEALCVVPGKELLDDFVEMVGARDSNGIARGARQHLEPSDFGRIGALSDQLRRVVTERAETERN